MRAGKAIALKANYLVVILVLAGLGEDSVRAATNTNCIATPPVLKNVMVGDFSSGTDQVWIPADGQPSGVAADSVVNGVSRFYVANDGDPAVNHAEALFLTAKATGQPVSIPYNINPTAADFWGFGSTRCVIQRAMIGQ